MSSQQPKQLPQQDLEEILEATLAEWKPFSGTRIFISGGTGFIGKWLLESLIWANRRANLNIRPTVLSRNPTAFQLNYPELASVTELTLIEGDVRKPFPLEGHELAIHAASDSNDAANSAAPLAMVDAILTGSRNLLEAASQAKCQRVLMLSTGAVYGDQPANVSHLAEDMATAPHTLEPTPKNLNGQSKRMMEAFAAHYAKQHQLPVTIARCFSFLGPYLPLDRHYAAGNFIRDALAESPITITGDGRTIRSYMHPLDLTIWLWHILLRGQSGRAYNVGSEKAFSLKELAEKVATHAPNPTTIQILASTSLAPPHRYIPATKRAEEELGLRLRLDIDQTLKRTMAWLTK